MHSREKLNDEELSKLSFVESILMLSDLRDNDDQIKKLRKKSILVTKAKTKQVISIFENHFEAISICFIASF